MGTPDILILTMIKTVIHGDPWRLYDTLPGSFSALHASLKLWKILFRYDPQAVCPRWDQFIQEVMCGNQELATYLQKALGYALSGDTRMECLFIL